MTDDSLGIRMQAQLLMERKLILREQQMKMREEIKRQKEEENKLKASIVRRHRKNSKKRTLSFPDIPHSESSFDELYASVNSKESKTKHSDDLTFDEQEPIDFNEESSVYKKRRTMTRESLILNELHTLNQDIDKELKSMDAVSPIIMNRTAQIKSYESYTSYNNKMIAMIRNQSMSGRYKPAQSPVPHTLPHHRSHDENQALLRIIHTIENMPRPESQFDANELISSVISEFPSSFRALLFQNKKQHLCTDEVSDDEAKEYEQENKKRDSLDLEIYGSLETVPPPNDLDEYISANSDDYDIDSPPNLIETSSVLAKKKKLKIVFNAMGKSKAKSLSEYELTEYLDSVLSDQQSSDDLIADDDENHVLQSLLSQSNLSSEIAFFNAASIQKHVALLLQIVCSLPLGLHHQREQILAAMLKKVSKLSNPCRLQQKLLFLYWSYADSSSINFDDSDFYLNKDYGSIILNFLSLLVDAQNAAKSKSNPLSTKHNDFIIEASKTWRKIIAQITTASNTNEIILNEYEKISNNVVPSPVLLPSMNLCNIKNYKILNQFVLDGIEFKKGYQYKNCNVYDLFCVGYHSNSIPNNKTKIKCPFLLRVGLDCRCSQMMAYIFELINCIWSSYKYNVANDG